MDLFEKLISNPGPLGKHSKVAHGYFSFPKLEGEICPRMRFRGKEVLVWSLNNYLGLANHPEVRKADAEAAKEYGLAYPMGARMMSGNSDLIEQLENELASFTGKEAAMLLNYGYQGIMSIIDALVDRHDVIVYDAESKGAILVITEGVFGMAGDMGNLKEIVALKKKFNFRLLINDAHGFGTMGATGAGTGEEQGVQEEVDLYFATFAKSMAGIGAFISSSKDIIDYLRYNTRSQIFAKTLPMPMVIGLRKRLELLRNNQSLRTKLWEVVNYLQENLKKVGFSIGRTQSPVTPVILSGTEGEAANMIVDLRENYNIFCSIVVYPVVPKEIMMLRIIPTAEHTLADVARTVKAFEEVSQKLSAGYYEKSLSGFVPVS